MPKCWAQVFPRSPIILRMKPEVFKMTHRAGHHLTLGVLVRWSSSPTVSPQQVSLHPSEAPDSFPPRTVLPPGMRLCLSPPKVFTWLTPPHLSGVRLSDSSSKTPSLTTPHQCAFPRMCVCVWAQPCSTLCSPTDYSLPHSSVREVFQARILE